MEINWNELTPMDLPGDLGEIASDCNMEFARYLVEMWGGAMIYIPTLSKLKKAKRDQLILRDYNGANVGKLASSFGVSRRYVNKVVRESGPSFEDDTDVRKL